MQKHRAILLMTGLRSLSRCLAGEYLCFVVEAFFFFFYFYARSQTEKGKLKQSWFGGNILEHTLTYFKVLIQNTHEGSMVKMQENANKVKDFYARLTFSH